MTKTRAEMAEQITGLKGMVRQLQGEIREMRGKDVLSVHRLPLTKEAMSAIADMSPKDARCYSKGGWFYVLRA